MQRNQPSIPVSPTLPFCSSKKEEVIADKMDESNLKRKSEVGSNDEQNDKKIKLSENTVSAVDQNKISANDKGYGQCLTAIMAYAGDEKTSSKLSYLEHYFLTTNTIFIWPINNEELTINVDVAKGLITLLDVEKNTVLAMSVTDKNIVINTVMTNKSWIDSDISELIDLFNLLFTTSVIDKSGKNKFDYVKQDGQESYFESFDEFKTLISRYQYNNRYLTLPHFLINHADFVENRYVSWIPWPKKQYKLKDLCLRIEISSEQMLGKSDPNYKNFSSHALAPESYIQRHGYDDVNFNCVRIKIFEHNSNSSSIHLEDSLLIADLWARDTFTFGEMREVIAGYYIGGNESLDVTNAIMDTLNVENTYTNDTSRAVNCSELAKKQIVFRVMKAIAEGVTWYDKKAGFKFFDCSNESVGDPNEKDLISQDIKIYKEDLNALRAMKVVDLYAYFQKEELSMPWETVSKDEDELLEKDMHRSENLLNLYKGYFKKDLRKDMQSNVTLGELAALINEKFIKNRTNIQVQEDMQRLYDILRLPRRHRFMPDYANAKPTKERTFYDLLRTLVFTQYLKKERKRVRREQSTKRFTV